MEIIEFMIALLAIIVTLGIAYNYYSIYRSDKRLDSIEAYYKLFSDQVAEETKRLEEELKRMAARSMLICLDSEVSDCYRSSTWLRALQKEFEIVHYICDNYVYFKSEFQGKIGFKRSSIAKILLEIGNNFDKTDYININNRIIDINDIFRTIIAQWTSIERSSVYSQIREYENDAYKELFLIAEELIKQIMGGRTQLNMPSNISEKLRYYVHKFGGSN